MSDVNLGAIKAKLEIDASGVDAGVARAKAALDQFGGSALAAAEGLVSVNAAFGAAGAIVGTVTAAFAAVGAAVLRLADQAERLKNLSTITGLSTESLQQFARTADIVGVSSERLTRGVQLMERNLANGAKGFDKIGISASALINLRPEQQFQVVAEKIAAIENPAQRVAAAMAVFGRSGAELVPILMELARNGESLAVTLTGDQLNALDALKDSVDRAKGSWGDLLDQFLAGIATSPNVVGALDDIADAMQRLAAGVKDNRQWFSDTITLWTAMMAKATGMLPILQALRAALVLSETGPTPRTRPFGMEAPSINIPMPSSAELEAERQRGVARTASLREAEAAARALQQQVDQISGAHAQAEMDRLTAAFARVGEGGVANIGSLIQQVQRLEQAGAEVPPVFEAMIERHQDFQREVSLTTRALQEFNSQQDRWIDEQVGRLGMPAQGMFQAVPTGVGEYGSLGRAAELSPEIERLATNMARAGRSADEIRTRLTATGAPASQIDSMMERIRTHQEDIANGADRWGIALEGVNMIASAVGGRVGGIMSALAQGLVNIHNAQATANMSLNQARAAAALQMAGAVGGAIGGTTGAVIQGAAGGAMTGLSLGGGWGAAVGAVIGAGVAWYQSSRQQREAAEQQTAAFNTQARALERQYGSLYQLERQMNRYGLTMQQAMQSENIDDVNEQLATMADRVKLVQAAMEGINTIMSNLTYTSGTGEVLSTFSDPATAEAAGQMFGSVFWLSFNRLGLEAIDKLSGAWQQLQEMFSPEQLGAMGLGGIGTVMERLQDPQIRALLEVSRGTSQVMSAYEGMGIMGLGMIPQADVLSRQTYEELRRQGVDANTVGQLMGDQLATLARAYEQTGQELPSWLVAAMQETGLQLLPTTNNWLEQIYNVLAGEAHASPNTGGATPTNNPRGGGGSETPSGGIPGYAFGGIGNFGAGTEVTLHGREAIIPLDRMPTSEPRGITQNVSVAMPPWVTNQDRRAFAGWIGKEVQKQLRNDPATRMAVQRSVNGGR